MSTRQSSGLFGSSTVFEVTATGEITRGGATDRLELDHLRYRVGDLLPTGGAIRITTSDGTQVAAAFRGDAPIVGQLVLTIDAHDPITLPTIH